MNSEPEDLTREMSAEAAAWSELTNVDGLELEIDDAAADAVTDSTLPHDLVLGEYVLLRPIGAGGVGRVFQARHRQMDRLVALKLLGDKALDRPDAVRRFRREIKAAARLFHPNIVTAFDAGQHQGVQYLVMEYVDGVSLRDLVRRHGPLSVEQACEYVRQAAVGLAFAHSRGVVHRDIKPGNLILDNVSETIKILDLGTALFMGAGEEEAAEDPPAAVVADPEGTQAGVVIGTVHYMAPEQLRGGVDQRADIYSLGCTLYFLLTGKPVFDLDDVARVLSAHASLDPPSLRDARPDAPAWLDAVFQRMLAKSPDQRFDSMEEVAEQLQDAASRLEAPLDPPRLRRAPPRLAVGLDLGCSSGMIAAAEYQEHRELTWEAMHCGDGLLAAVSLDGMNLHLGERAWKDAGGRMVAADIRRYVGQRLYPYPLGDSSFPPEALLGVLLHRLNVLRGGETPSRCALGVPSTFGQGARQAMLDAARIAGLPEPILINESLAALLSESLRREMIQGDPHKWLVLDLGGGKLDVLAAEVGEGVIEVAAAGGDPQLGGCQWDELLLQHVSEQCLLRFQVDPREHAPTAARLRRTCEQAKIALTTESHAPIDFKVDGRLFRLNVTSENFERMGGPLVERLQAAVEDCLELAGWDLAEVDQLLLVGRATRTPAIRSWLAGRLRRSSPMHEASTTAVARGAAVVAWRQMAIRRGLQPAPELRLRATLGVGVSASVARTGQRRDTILIPRGSRLPHRFQRMFRTREDNQATVSLRIIESRRSDGEQCQVVGFCEADLPRGLPAGSPILVQFLLGADERLTISLETPNTGYRITKDISHRGRLSQVEINRWKEWLDTLVLCSSS